MKILYIECNMGVAGDMLMGALYELCDQKDKFLSDMNHAFAPYGVTLSAEPAVKCGISGTHMRVAVHGEEEHSHDVLPEHVHENGHIHAHEHTHDENEHTHTHDNNSHHEHHHTHAHTSYTQILDQIHTLPFPSSVKDSAAAVYRLIGKPNQKCTTPH